MGEWGGDVNLLGYRYHFRLSGEMHPQWVVCLPSAGRVGLEFAVSAAQSPPCGGDRQFSTLPSCLAAGQALACTSAPSHSTDVGPLSVAAVPLGALQSFVPSLAAQTGIAGRTAVLGVPVSCWPETAFEAAESPVPSEQDAARWHSIFLLVPSLDP